MAPDLLLAECGNVLWKQVRRGDIRPDQALQAAQALAQSDVELRPMRALLSLATELAIQIEHPAYDCFYLALARLEGCDLVTSDERFLRKLEQNRNSAGVRSLSSFTR